MLNKRWQAVTNFLKLYSCRCLPSSATVVGTTETFIWTFCDDTAESYSKGENANDGRGCEGLLILYFRLSKIIYKLDLYLTNSNSICRLRLRRLFHLNLQPFLEKVQPSWYMKKVVVLFCIKVSIHWFRRQRGRGVESWDTAYLWSFTCWDTRWVCCLCAFFYCWVIDTDNLFDIRP